MQPHLMRMQVFDNTNEYILESSIKIKNSLRFNYRQFNGRANA